MDDQTNFLSTIAIVKASLFHPEHSNHMVLSDLEKLIKDYQKLVFLESRKSPQITSDDVKEVSKQIINLKNMDEFSGSIKDLFNKINED